MKNPIVTMKTAKGVVEIELYPNVAPNTVNNFISLIQKGFYNGTLFHRVIPHFMVQGGDPLGNGTGGPGYSIRGEFTSNRFQNDLKHERGVISMARTVDPNSAGSQFFIMVENSPYLDGEYASFGRVTSGMEEVDRIVNTPRDYDDKPLEDEAIESMVVETFGETYEKPKTV